MARISTGKYKAAMRAERGSWGTYPADFDTDGSLLFITSPSLQVVPTKEEDPALLGNQFPADFVTTNKIVSGSFGFSAHPEGMNNIIYHHLGKVKSTGDAPSGSLCIFYTGAAESCLMVVTANVLGISIGAEGAEAPDGTFAAAGFMDFTDPAYDTIDKCVALINTYPGYRAYKIGDGSSDTATIPDLATYGSAAISNTEGSFTGATVPALASATYDLDITIDGGANNQVAAALLVGDSWAGIAAKIQTALRALTTNLETVTITDGKIVVTSDTAGPTSSVLIAAGTAGSGGGDLLAAIDLIAGYTTDLDTPIAGADGAFHAKGSAFQSRTNKLDALFPAATTKKHTIASMIIGENADSFSFAQSLGTALAQAFTGLKAGQLSLDIPNGGLITGTSNVIGKEKIDVVFPAIPSFENTAPMVAGNMRLYIDGELLGYNAVSVEYNPNLFAEVEGGSFFQGEAQNGKKINMSVSPGFHWDEDTKTKIYDRFQNDEQVEVCLVVESFDDAETGVKYSQFWRLTLCQITESQPDAGGEVFNLPSKLDVLQPTEDYFRPVEVEVISKKTDLTA